MKRIRKKRRKGKCRQFFIVTLNDFIFEECLSSMRGTALLGTAKTSWRRPQQILHQCRSRHHLRGRAEAGPPHLPRFLPPPLRGLRDIRIPQDDRAGGRADPRHRTLPAHSLLLLILSFSLSQPKSIDFLDSFYSFNTSPQTLEHPQ